MYMRFNVTRANIVIEDKSIEEGMAYAGIKTKRELVNYALRDLMERKIEKDHP